MLTLSPFLQCSIAAGEEQLNHNISQRKATALHRLAAHCYARRITQSKFRA